MTAEGSVDVLTAAHGVAVPTRTVRARELARTVGGGALLGAPAGLLVGGVLGRLAMGPLAVTSPAWAHGRMTDDQALAGTVSLGGTLRLALATTVAGALAGLVYLWVRRFCRPPVAAGSPASGCSPARWGARCSSTNTCPWGPRRCRSGASDATVEGTAR